MLGGRDRSAHLLLMVGVILNKCSGGDTHNSATKLSTSRMNSGPQNAEIPSANLPADASVFDFGFTVGHGDTEVHLAPNLTIANSTALPKRIPVGGPILHHPNRNDSEDVDQTAREQDHQPSLCKFDWYSDRTHCECFRSCPSTKNDRRQLACGKNNVTYESDCSLYNRRCQCSEDIKSCEDPAAANDTLDYYGQCTELGTCPDLQYEQFPERISNWIKNSVCEWMDSRNGGGKGLTIARANPSSAAAFVFCLTDVNKDSVWQHEEMAYLLATFKALEPCFQRYLQDCDTNGDETLDMKEWATCLKINYSQPTSVDCNV